MTALPSPAGIMMTKGGPTYFTQYCKVMICKRFALCDGNPPVSGEWNRHVITLMTFLSLAAPKFRCSQWRKFVKMTTFSNGLSASGRMWLAIMFIYSPIDSLSMTGGHSWRFVVSRDIQWLWSQRRVPNITPSPHFTGALLVVENGSVMTRPMLCKVIIIHAHPYSDRNLIDI